MLIFFFNSEAMAVFILETNYVERLERHSSKSSSSRRVMHLVPVFILETDNRTNYEMFAEARSDR